MAIVVRRACLRERQLRPHPARGAGRHRRRQPRPRRLLRRRRDHRAAADGRRARTSARDAIAFPVFNGTGANVVGLRAMLRPWQGVICAESAHLNVDEGGAPEAMGGIKLLTVPTPDGKLTPELVDRADRADRRRARRPARRGVGDAVDRARHAVLARRAARARRARPRARDAVPHRRLAAGQRRRVAGLLAARDHDRRRRRRGLASAAPRSALLAGRGRRRAATRAAAVAAVPAQAVDAAGVEDALRLRAAARAVRGRPVAPRRRPRQRDGGAAGRRRGRRA